MDAETYSVFLRRLLSRSALGEAERDSLAALRASPERIGANRDIVCPGELRDHACLVVKGLAARFDQSHPHSRIDAQPVRKDAARAACTHNNVVERFHFAPPRGWIRPELSAYRGGLVAVLLRTAVVGRIY